MKSVVNSLYLCVIKPFLNRTLANLYRYVTLLFNGLHVRLLQTHIGLYYTYLQYANIQQAVIASFRTESGFWQNDRGSINERGRYFFSLLSKNGKEACSITIWCVQPTPPPPISNFPNYSPTCSYRLWGHQPIPATLSAG